MTARPVVAWTVIVAMLAVVAAGVVGVVSAGSPPQQPAPTVTGTEADAQALAGAVERAWGDGDRDGFLRLAAPTDASQAAAADTWRALTLLDVDELSLRVLGLSDQGSAQVQVTWAEAGWRSTASSELAMSVADCAEPQQLCLVGIAPSPGRPAPAWALAPLTVRSTASGASVVALGGQAIPRDLVATVERAAVSVSARVRAGEGRARVVIGASAADVAGLVGRADDGTLPAAVASTVDGSSSRQTPAQVVLNGEVLGQLTPLGREVLLTHELVHVMTGAAGAALPLWLAEGYADAVALDAADVPAKVAAGNVQALVRREGAPARLPSAEDFAEATAQGSDVAYILSWVAVRTLQQQIGWSATNRVHQAAVDGQSLSAALRAEDGPTVAELTSAWRAELVRLSRAAG